MNTQNILKKAVSVFLAAIVALTLVPISTVGVFATDYDFSNPDVTVYEIASAEDWNALAAAAAAKGESFDYSGKTIKLTASFDAKGATLKPLAPNNFKGVFDGGNFTVSNAVSELGLVATTALASNIKNVTFDGIICNKAAGDLGIIVKVARGTVKFDNVTLKNSTKTAEGNGGVGGLIGALYSGGGIDIDNCIIDVNVTAKAQCGIILGRASNANNFIEITNTTVTGSVTAVDDRAGAVIGDLVAASATIKNVSANVMVSASSTASGGKAVGGFIGRFAPAEGDGAAFLTVENSKMTGKVTLTKGHLGGFLGLMSVKNFTGTATFKNCENTANLTNYDPNSNYGTAAIVGCWGHVDVKSASKLNIINCVAGGEIYSTANSDSGAAQNSVGGIVGHYGAVESTLNIHNCIVTATFPKNLLTKTDGNGAGIIIGRSMRTTANVSILNCVTTASGASGNNWYMVSNCNNLNVNGKNSGNQYATYTDDSVISVNEDIAQMMITRDTNGMIKNIAGHLNGNYVQTAKGTDKYSVRFVATSYVANSKLAGFKVVVKDENGSGVKSFTTDECQIYDKLLGNTEYGIEEYLPQDLYGANKFMAFTILNIPTGAAYTFEVTPYYTTSIDDIAMEGATVTFIFDATGTLTNGLV